MSRPCLPVPPRQRKRRLNNNHDDQQQLSFENIESMDAMEYIGLVVQQSQSMPDVFVSSSRGTENHLSQEENNKTIVLNDHSQQSTAISNKNIKGKNSTTKSVTAGKIPLSINSHSCLASLSYLLSDHTIILSPPTNRHIPFKNTRPWVDNVLHNFSKLREYIDHCKHNGVGGKETSTRMTNLPKLKDRSGWHIFCLGYTEARGNVNNYFDTGDGDCTIDDQCISKNDDESDTIVSANNEEDDDDNKGVRMDNGNDGSSEREENNNENENNITNNYQKNGHEPTVKLLLQMDQVMIRRILHHLFYYIDDGWIPYTKQCTAWLYALLANLEKPIHRDDAHVLRNTLKILTQLRHDYSFKNHEDSKCNSKSNCDDDNDDDDNLKRLNLLIVIIGMYFEQGNGYDGLMCVVSTNK